MATTTFELNYDLFARMRVLRQRVTARGLWLGLILLAALVAFEMFNFATTEFALQSLFGSHDALGITTWAKVLAIAFCGIDFAGLSRLFTPETGRKEPKEIWLLTGAWFLGAGMNAIMTWWAVGSALSENPYLGNELVTRGDVLKFGPIFIAALVWLTRVLIIGTFAFAGDHLFSTADRRDSVIESKARPLGSAHRTTVTPAQPRAVPKPSSDSRSLPEPAAAPIGSSSYARSMTDARSGYTAQRSYFGSGAGSSSYRQPAASQAASPAAAMSSTASTTRTVSPATGFGASRASGDSAHEEPRPAQTPLKWAEPRSSQPRAEKPLRRPDAFDGPSSRADSHRASTTRTIASDARQPASVPAPQPASMELEYVDLD